LAARRALTRGDDPFAWDGEIEIIEADECPF
jgi:hypothetical protein